MAAAQSARLGDSPVGTVVSVDLAYKRYEGVGIAVLSHDGPSALRARFVKAPSLGLCGSPDPEDFARALGALCSDLGASVVLLDGPQAWKDPENGLAHSRICEHALNTPAKTGLPGHARPANYAPFVRFSVAVFDALLRHGAQLLLGGAFEAKHARLLALESFPLSAWRGIHLSPLPGKNRARPQDIRDRCRSLCEAFRLEVADDPTYDELQALVAGLGGAAYQRAERDSLQIVGAAPRIVCGVWREGFIVNPRREPQPRPA